MKVLRITVKPGSAYDEVEALSATEFVIRTPAPAKGGRANKEILKLLARHLHVSISSLLVSQGERWNEKTILLLDDSV